MIAPCTNTEILRARVRRRRRDDLSPFRSVRAVGIPAVHVPFSRTAAPVQLALQIFVGSSRSGSSLGVSVMAPFAARLCSGVVREGGTSTCLGHSFSEASVGL